jgi:hypothetical protein
VRSDVVSPHFLSRLRTAFPNGEWQLNVRDDGERGSASPLAIPRTLFRLLLMISTVKPDESRTHISRAP